jgi:hypothetical protein
MITLAHSACLLLGGSFEPTYILTITALSIQLQPTTNKRNAALIQAFLNETLGVPSNRGIIKFHAIQAENLATNGSTVYGDIQRLEQKNAEDTGGSLKKVMTRSSRRSTMGKSKSSIQLSRDDSKIDRPSNTARHSNPGPFDSGVAVDGNSIELQAERKGSAETSPPGLKTSAKRRPSKGALSEMFGGRHTTAALPTLAPPPIPEEAERPRTIGKKKSLMTLFRR